MDGKVLENSMAVYLNTNSALILYKELKNSRKIPKILDDEMEV